MSYDEPKPCDHLDYPVSRLFWEAHQLEAHDRHVTPINERDLHPDRDPDEVQDDVVATIGTIQTELRALRAQTGRQQASRTREPSARPAEQPRPRSLNL